MSNAAGNATYASNPALQQFAAYSSSVGPVYNEYGTIVGGSSASGSGGTGTSTGDLLAADTQNTEDESTLLQSILTTLSGNGSTTAVSTPWYESIWVWALVLIVGVIWLIK